MITRRSLIIAVLIAHASVRLALAADQENLIRLPSGKQFKVLKIVNMHFSAGPPALMLQYQTDIPITDVASLQREADEVWEVFRPEVEKVELVNAVVAPTTEPKGILLKESTSYGFIYIRGSDGKWARQPNKASAK
jgi:hypothetical protein